MVAANLLEIIVRARDQTKAAFASAKKGIVATKTATSGLSKNLGGLNKSFSAVSGKVSRFSTKLKGLMTSAIGPLIGVMGIAAITLALKKAVDAFGSFEQAAANASSVTGKTGAAFVETKEHIMAVSKVLGETTVFKASEAADAFYDLASAGYDVANITKTELKPILDLAAASQTDLKATTELVTSTLGQFGMAIQDSKKVADVFARTIGSSKATMEKLGNSMVYVGPVAHALGRSLEETSATLGILYNKGFDASMAGTALRGALSRLMNPTAQVEAKLSELGVTVAEVNPETRSMADILDVLTSAGMDTADAMELFGLRAGPAMLALTQNTDDIRSLTLELENAGGAAAIMAEQQLTTFEGKMKLVSSKLEATSLILGERFAPMILNAANTITDVIIPALGGFSDAISKKLNPALGPLREKLGVAFEKMSGGVSIMQRLKDVGVILGSTLRVLADAFGWVIEKLNPLWELTGKLQSGISILADLLRTEGDYTNDLTAAVELLNVAKAKMVMLNEKLIIRMSDLAKEIEKSSWGMGELNRLESNVITAKAAHTAIQSELNAALSRGDLDTYNEKERELITATEFLEKATAAYHKEILGTAESQIDYGTATDGIIIAHREVVKSLDEIEEGLQTEIRLEEDAALATEKAAGAHLVLNDGITGVVKNLKDNLLFNLDLLIFRLGEFIDLVASAGAGIEKGLTFAFPGYKALKEAFENIIVLEEKLVDETETSMDAVEAKMEATLETIAERTKETNEEVIKSWEDRRKEIKVQLEIETKGYQFLTDVQKEEADKRIAILNDDDKAFEDSIDARDKHLSSLTNVTKEVTETMEELSISVGKTTLTFKGASAEVLKNAAAYEKLQKAAQTLIDMDWSVFTEFEASLPIIEAGIGDLESSFVGFKEVLENNIDKLEAVKQSVMDISEIAAPFLEAGFLNGIKAISDFAGALKNAGSAISDFTSLQDVSIEGAINFSLHVHDMVSALAILEDQMADLEPLFGSLNSLIGDITETFVYSGDKITDFSAGFAGVAKGVVGDFDDIGIGISKSTDALDAFYEGERIRAEGWAAIREKWGTSLIPTGADKSVLGIGAAATMKEAAEKLEFEKSTVQSLNEFINDMVTAGTITWTEGNTTITKGIADRASAIAVLDGMISKAKLLTDEPFIGTTLGSLDLSAFNTTISGGTKNLQEYMKTTYGVTISTQEMFDIMAKPPEEQQVWFEEQLRTNEAVTFQWNKQTAAIEANGEKLKQLTEAMGPHLAFMRTLNELAQLSTLSTAELNSGLDAITDTLTNLGTALRDFDLSSTMESLFGTKISGGDLEGEFTGGFATPFVDVLQEFAVPFNELIVYTTRLTSAITGLVSAFDTLGGISDSVLLDTTALTKVFDDMVKILNNLEEAFGKNGFGGTIADALGDMIKSAAPLTDYFQKNNAAVMQFNNTLGMFKTTITNVVDTMDMLKKMSEMVLPSVDELDTGFDKAAEAVSRFDEALLTHLGITTKGYEEGAFKVIDEEAFSSNIVTRVTEFANSWALVDKALGESDETFVDATKTITNMGSAIISLTETFQALEDISIISSDQIAAGFEKIKDVISELNKGMEEFARAGLSELTISLDSVATMWLEWDKNLGDSSSTFADAVTDITALVSAITALAAIQKQLSELDVVSGTKIAESFNKATMQVYQFQKGMKQFSEEGFASLVYNLKEVDTLWSDWSEQLGDSPKTFNEASSSIGGLASSVTGLVSSFVSLAEMPVLTEEAFGTGMKNMATDIQNFAAALEDNIDAIEKALEAVDEAWSDHAANMEKLVPIFDDASSSINSLAGNIMSLIRSFESLKDIEFAEEFETGFDNLITATGAFATALNNNIDELVHSLDRLVSTWMENEVETVRLMKGFIIIANNFMIVIDYANRLQEAFGSMTTEAGILSTGFDELIKFMDAVMEGVKKIYTAEGAADLALFVTDVGLVVDAIVTLEGKMKTVMDTIRTKIDNTVGDIKTKVRTLGTMAKESFDWGAKLMTSFVAGLRSEQEALRLELIDVSDLIEKYLGVGSNTKLGALSHLTDWPENLIKTFAEGIHKGTPELSKALSALTLPTENLHMPAGYAGMLGGRGNTLTMYNTWNIENKEDADYAIREIETLLTRRSVI